MTPTAILFAVLALAAGAFGYFSAALILAVLFLLFLTLALAKPDRT